MRWVLVEKEQAEKYLFFIERESLSKAEERQGEGQ